MPERVEPPLLAGSRRVPGSLPRPRQRWRHLFVAVDAADLLGHVLGDAHVQPVDRRQHVPLAVVLDTTLEVEALQDHLHLLQRDVDTQYGIDPLRTEPDARGLLRPGVDVGPAEVDTSTG